jgi:hypothetical protein
MIEKLLLIENQHVVTMREILSNLHLEEETIIQGKSMHRCALLLERIILRKKARSLRTEKESILKICLQELGPLDFEDVYDAILSIFPTTDIGQISELKHLEWQKQVLTDKSLLQLKLNKNMKGVIHHHAPIPLVAEAIANKKKTLLL